MSLGIVVQHHPSRAGLIPALRSRLGDCRVVTDPNPDSRTKSPLRCYLECIRQAPRTDHLVIVQDDAWPCDNFRERAEAFIRLYPESLIPFFVPGTGSPGGAVKRALRRGDSATPIPTGGWLPTVALSWPYEAAQAFLRWAEDYYDVERTRGDDGPAGKWREENHVAAHAPVPSLVQHPDVVDSLFRRKAGKAGRNKARVARAFSP